jgi:hypothetical protein
LAERIAASRSDPLPFFSLPFIVTVHFQPPGAPMRTTLISISLYCIPKWRGSLREWGGSATGVLITDGSHGPCGDGIQRYWNGPGFTSRKTLPPKLLLLSAPHRYPIIASGFLFQLKSGHTSAPRLPLAEQMKRESALLDVILHRAMRTNPNSRD